MTEKTETLEQLGARIMAAARQFHRENPNYTWAQACLETKRRFGPQAHEAVRAWNRANCPTPIAD
jgi:hypothetical protein